MWQVYRGMTGADRSAKESDKNRPASVRRSDLSIGMKEVNGHMGAPR